LMSIALVWAHKVGEWLSQTKPIPLKNRAQAHTDPTHKARKLYSTFRYGLDYLRSFSLLQKPGKTNCTLV
jgi:hypothetical protein